MINVCLQRVVLLGFIGLFLPTSLWAQYSGGSGTAQDPYQIGTAAHFANITNNPTAYFRLIDDITITAFPGIEFSGELNGATATELDRHVITLDVTIENQDYAAMFRKITGGAVIENLRLTGQFMGDEIKSAAVIAVDMDGGAIVRDIFSNVEMVIGGEACCGDDQGPLGHGGLVGRIFNGTLSRSANWGRTEAYLEVGGLVGINQGEVVESFNAGLVVSAGGNGAGGLVGSNNGNIVSSYSAGRVESNFNCGGLTGGHSAGGQVVEITHAYSSDVVACSGSSNVGGLIGQRATDQFEVPYPVVGSFWDITTSGQATSEGGDGKTTEQMTTEATFTSAGWDFTATGAWTMENLNQHTDAIYPSLKNVPSDVCEAGEFSQTGFEPCRKCIGETNRGERFGATSCSTGFIFIDRFQNNTASQ
ncbi:MAG TPA: hypothetical protein VIC53_06140 [Wenzhouxiangella sp.]